jgi:hypothetical protein
VIRHGVSAHARAAHAGRAVSDEDPAPCSGLPSEASDAGARCVSSRVTFSARWSGQVDCPTSETYTFSTVSDDGLRLWIDGKLVIDNWTLHGATTNNGALALATGMHAVRLDYFENSGLAVMKLSWATPTRASAIIPKAALYPAALTAVEFEFGPSSPIPAESAADSGRSRCGMGGGIAILLGLMLIARRRRG